MNAFKFIVLGIIAFGLFTCRSTHDELWLNPDGGGTIETSTDFTVMIPFLAMGLDFHQDTLQEDSPILMFKNLLSREKVDTIIEMRIPLEYYLVTMEGRTYEGLLQDMERELLTYGEVPDSVKTSLSNIINFIDELKFRLELDKTEGSFFTGVIFDFPHYETITSLGEDLLDLGYFLENKKVENDEKRPGSSALGFLELFYLPLTTMPQFEIEGNYFRYNFHGNNLSTFTTEGGIGMANMISQMMGADEYTMTVHFPGKIKKINSGNDSVKKLDRETIRINTSFDDLNDPDYKVDLEVKFKLKKK